MLDPIQCEMIFRLYEQRWTYAKIAEEVGCCDKTVQRKVKQYKEAPPFR